MAGWGMAPFTGGASVVAANQASNMQSRDPSQPYDPSQAYVGMPQAPTSAIPGVNLDRSGLDAFGKEAMRTGPSKWSQLALGQNEDSRQKAVQDATASAASSGQQARDSMAMQGGLTGGAAERTAMDQSRNALGMTQDVNRQANSNALQVGVNDEQNRISELGQLPGMQLGASNFDLSKAGAQDQFNAQNYSTQGGIWAAGQQANAEDPRNPSSPNYDDHKRWYNPFTW